MCAEDVSFESWWNWAKAMEGALGKTSKDDKFVRKYLDSSGDSGELDVVVVKVEPPLIDLVSVIGGNLEATINMPFS